MCGILGIISFGKGISPEELARASSIIKHRGPDDEGFLTLNPGEDPKIWAGKDTADSTKQYWKYSHLPTDIHFQVALAHRRLSILDLTPAGHQPMQYKDAGLSISFNGEVYNYLEIRAELESLGHSFVTKCDTEVILHAWAQWGVACLDKFNGMFAFIIIDNNKGEIYAVRDRFGVKPMYYYHKDDKIVLASEIKQIRTTQGFKTELNENIVADFLGLGLVDHTNETFDKQVMQLPAGHFAYINFLSPSPNIKLEQWYTLKPGKWNNKSLSEAAEQFKALLTDAVKLRLRADVSVGSCLSGGLDSSSIVCLAAQLLRKEKHFVGQETVTACYDILKYDEWEYAEAVVKHTQARSHRVFPGFRDIVNEFDAYTWYQDEPTASSSTFSQWAVFKKTHEVGLKVMIDGQGADEQLAGYTGNDISLYTGLIKSWSFGKLLKEISAYKSKKNQLPVSFILGALQIALGQRVSSVVMPGSWRLNNKISGSWIKKDMYAAVPRPTLIENLYYQAQVFPLPGFLRYEDRNSMAWSIESRTPFMDYRLFEFVFGLPDEFIYSGGVTKKVMREAMKDVLPQKVLDRKDKMGFVSPEEVWLKGEGKEWFMDWLKYMSHRLPEFVDGQRLEKEVVDIIDSKKPFNFLPWRVSVLGNWLNKNC